MENLSTAMLMCSAYGKGKGSGENPLFVGIKTLCDNFAGIFARAYSGQDPFNEIMDDMVEIPANIRRFCNSTCAISMYSSASQCYRAVAIEIGIPWDFICAWDSRNATRKDAFGQENLCNDNALESAVDALDVFGSVLGGASKLRRILRGAGVPLALP